MPGGVSSAARDDAKRGFRRSGEGRFAAATIEGQKHLSKVWHYELKRLRLVLFEGFGAVEREHAGELSFSRQRQREAIFESDQRRPPNRDRAGFGIQRSVLVLGDLR